MADIFLSYARADRARIAQLASSLEAGGHTLWWDKNIDGGAEFSTAIERELLAARAVIVAWSEDSVSSRWVRDEAGIALEADKLIAISLDGTPPPIGFKQIHAIDMRGPDGDADFKRSLANKLSAEEAPSAFSPPAPAKRTPKAAVFALPLLAAVGGLGYFAWEGGMSGDGTEATAAQASAKSIAILPFRDLSAEPQSWFSDGLAQEISAALSRTPDLKVAATSEAFLFRERAESVAVMGASLNVAHILDGAVRRSLDRIVVDIELIETATGDRLFTQRYDRPLADTITVQEDIAVSIARALDTALDPEALAELVDSGTNSLEAHEEFLRGSELNQYGDAEGYAVLGRYRRAAEIDPQWSRAHTEVARTISLILSAASTSSDFQADREALSAEFQRVIKRAVATARTDIDRNAALIVGHVFNGEYRAAERVAERLTRLAPENKRFWSELGMIQVILGNTKAATVSFDRYAAAADKDWDLIINRYYDSRAYEKAAAAYDSTPQSDRGEASFVYQSHRVLLSVGRMEEAAALGRDMQRYDILQAYKTMVSIRQACAEDDRTRAMRLAEGLADTNSRWQALMMLGQTDEAVATMRPFDYAKPPFPLADLLSYSFFDPRPFPNLMKLMAREGIRVPERLFFQPPACPPGEETRE